MILCSSMPREGKKWRKEGKGLGIKANETQSGIHLEFCKEVVLMGFMEGFKHGILIFVDSL